MGDNKEYRIVIKCSEETWRRWRRLSVDAGAKNYEVLANRLIDLYDLVSDYFGERKIDELIEKLRELLGLTVKMKIVTNQRSSSSYQHRQLLASSRP